jgi:hypothetical protein
LGCCCCICSIPGGLSLPHATGATIVVNRVSEALSLGNKNVIVPNATHIIGCSPRRCVLAYVPRAIGCRLGWLSYQHANGVAAHSPYTATEDSSAGPVAPYTMKGGVHTAVYARKVVILDL